MDKDQLKQILETADLVRQDEGIDAAALYLMQFDVSTFLPTLLSEEGEENE